MMGLIGLVLWLLLLMTLAYRRQVPSCLRGVSMFAVAFSGELPFLATYTQIFMPAFGQTSRSSFRCSCLERCSAS